MIKQNKYERLFDEFLDLTEFRLIRHQDDYNKRSDEYGRWSLVDCQGANLGDIESARFKNARDILEQMDIYIHDYIIEALEDCLDEAGYDYYTGNYQGLIEYCRDKLSENQWDLDVLDMICNHPDEINLENCTFEELSRSWKINNMRKEI